MTKWRPAACPSRGRYSAPIMSHESPSNDTAGLREPVGMASGETLPSQVSILASVENLGRLLSVHRPATWFCRIQFRDGVYLVFERGLVLSQRNGVTLKLFKVGHMRIMNTRGRSFLLAGPQGQAGCLALQWSDGKVLAAELAKLALSNPWR